MYTTDDMLEYFREHDLFLNISPSAIPDERIYDVILYRYGIGSKEIVWDMRCETTSISYGIKYLYERYLNRFFNGIERS